METTWTHWIFSTNWTFKNHEHNYPWYSSTFMDVGEFSISKPPRDQDQISSIQNPGVIPLCNYTCCLRPASPVFGWLKQLYDQQFFHVFSNIPAAVEHAPPPVESAAPCPSPDAAAAWKRWYMNGGRWWQSPIEPIYNITCFLKVFFFFHHFISFHFF